MGRQTFHQRVYVLGGKSLKINAQLDPEKPQEDSADRRPDQKPLPRKDQP
jgi:hypothetical protein